MRKTDRIVLAAALIGAAACAPESPKELSGTIVGATAATVTIAPQEGGQILFSTEGADMEKAFGLLAGNSATVTYRGKLKAEGTPALRVASDRTYVTALGRWVEPNPIAPEQEQGIELRLGGEARSINMHTLRYRSWEVTGTDEVLLRGTSEGSGGEFEFEQSARIVSREGRMFLQIDSILLQKKDLV